MRFLICVFVILTATVAWGSWVTESYNTQIAEGIGDSTGDISGEIDFVYETGGTSWKDIRSKFKKLWAVFLTPQSTEYTLYYDHENEEIKAFNRTGFSEVTNLSVITDTKFIAKGEK